MEKGKCSRCGVRLVHPTAKGYCMDCALEIFKDPVFIVKFGNNSETFEIESEAQKFLDELHNAVLVNNNPIEIKDEKMEELKIKIKE